ncbi:MAG: 50S ribosomal protein L5 [Nanoarchaeota archaeon]
MNKMRAISIEKINLNIGTGGQGDKMEKSLKLLSSITGEKPVSTKTKLRIPEWGVRPGLSIGCKVTLRGKKAVEIFRRLLSAVNNTLKESNFDKFGNFSFGIKEYLDIPGVKYDPDIGITGLEVAVTLKRPGFRVKRRALRRGHIPKRHQIAKSEAIEFIKSGFNANILGGEK